MTATEAVATQIIEAARQLFLRSGYSRVSTEEIVRSIGRSKKTLYKHFATKALLLHAVLGRDEAALAQVIAAQAGEADRSLRLRRTLIQVVQHLASTQQVLFADLRANEPGLGEQAWSGRRQALARILRPVLVEAVADGAVRDDLPVDRVLEIVPGCTEAGA